MSYGGNFPQIRPKYDTFIYFNYPYEILKQSKQRYPLKKKNCNCFLKYFPKHSIK